MIEPSTAVVTARAVPGRPSTTATMAASSLQTDPAPQAPPFLPWRGTRISGGLVPSDDDLLERTLSFSGTYVSDEGHLTIRRSPGSFEYSGSRFLGSCRSCAAAGVIPPTEEPLPDVTATIRFARSHQHGDVD